MKQSLTEEQKQRRAETARRNGAKSKGPVTPEGKHRSSMNAITVGDHVDVHDEELPAFARILSVEDRKAYVRLQQANLRHYRPQSDTERGLVRNITAEQFAYERYGRIETLQFQSEHDETRRESPEIPAELLSGFAIERSLSNDRLHRLIERKRRAHLIAWTKLVALYERMRRTFPAPEPEPAAKTGLLDTVEPILEVVRQAENEPSLPLPENAVYLIHNEPLMRKFAPYLDVAELRRRYPLPKSPRAA
jgi:hypothetical protein